MQYKFVKKKKKKNIQFFYNTLINIHLIVILFNYQYMFYNLLIMILKIIKKENKNIQIIKRI